MSAYKEFTGKSVEEALRVAREEFGVDLSELDFEILTPGSRGVLGMGAEPARIVAAPRSALGGATPKREAAAATPLPARPPREERPRDDRGPRRDGGRREDRGPRREERPRDERPREERPGEESPREERPSDERPREERPREERAARREERPDRGRRPGGERPPRREDRAPAGLNAEEAAQVAAARGSVASERADLEAAEASPEALAAGREILEELMKHLGFEVKIEIETGDTSRLNVVGGEDGHEALGALIGRKGERLSALQHLVNLMLSRRMGEWTRVLVDVEDYRGRRERQLRDIALRAAARVQETGKMLQLEPMPALERRWIHLALRDHPDVATQSIGEEPNRRIVVLMRGG
jgi:spoIIIJ-associated protein